MTKLIRTAAACAAAAVCAIAPLSAAGAQGMMPNGSEIIGHSVQVEANGLTNTVYFDPGGNARILTPGGTEVPGRYTIANNQLCLSVSNLRECWPLQQAFQAVTPVTLTSDCAVTSRWTPISTAPTAPPARSGERG